MLNIGFEQQPKHFLSHQRHQCACHVLGSTIENESCALDALKRPTKADSLLIMAAPECATKVIKSTTKLKLCTTRCSLQS